MKRNAAPCASEGLFGSEHKRTCRARIVSPATFLYSVGYRAAVL